MVEVKFIFGKDEINDYLNCKALDSLSQDLHIKKFSFDSKLEADAFILGINEGSG